MSKPSAPPAPDYTGAAEATAAGDLAALNTTSQINHPDQYTPWGTSTWTQGADVVDQAGFDAATTAYNTSLDAWNTQMAGLPDFVDTSGIALPPAPTIDDYTTAGTNWTQNVTLSPEQQALFDQQQQTDLLMGQTAQAGLESASDLFSTRFETGLDPLGTYGDRRQGIEEAMLSRVNTDIGRDRETSSAQLIAQGIPKGSEAYNRAMEQLDRKQTDARQQAEISATQQTSQMMNDDINSRRQAITELLSERQTPLNELNSLRTGTQIQNPQFSNVIPAGQVAGPDYMGATTAQGAYDMSGYNADVAGNNAMTGGLFGLGAAYLGAP